MHLSQAAYFEAAVLDNPWIRVIWDAWDDLMLPNGWLVAGCLAQTIWNRRFGFAVEHGISDLDIVYFDPEDMSEASEQRHAERIRRILSVIPAWIDVKNEARVHLWYERKFGFPIVPYRSVTDAIDTFPTTATTIGIRPDGDTVQLYSTFGLEDMLQGIVRANKRLITREIFEAKASKWQTRWPGLRIVPWDALPWTVKGSKG